MMRGMSNYSEDWVDGRRVEPLVVDTAATVSDHRGGIIVRPGASFRLTGTLQGSLTLETGAVGVVAGEHQGSIHVADKATLTIESRQQGSLHIATGGVVTIARSGSSQGSVHVDGLLLNEGARGGSTSGSGEIRDVPGCRVVQPVKRGNATYYEW